MNPFTESTVAQPLIEPLDPSVGGGRAWPASFSDTAADPAGELSPAAEAQIVEQTLCPTGARAKGARPVVPIPARCLLSVSSMLRRRPMAQSVPSYWERGVKDLVMPFVRRKKYRSFFTDTLGAMGVAAGLSLAFPTLALAVDVNAATQAQLEAVRGIGPKTAQIIIQERGRGGDYESFQDLSERVKGIGPKKAASLQAAGLTLGAAKPGIAAKAVIPPQHSRTGKPRP